MRAVQTAARRAHSLTHSHARAPVQDSLVRTVYSRSLTAPIVPSLSELCTVLLGGDVAECMQRERAVVGYL